MRLRKVVEAFPGKFELVHRSFVLRGERNDNATFTEYNLQHRRRAKEMTGMPYDLPPVGTKYPSSSMPALTAAKYVQLRHPEAFDCYDLALFAAFFERTEDISDPAVLSRLASDCGLSGESVLRALDDATYSDAVMADYLSAQRAGVSGVPAVFIGNQLITGAVPLEEYMAAVHRLR